MTTTPREYNMPTEALIAVLCNRECDPGDRDAAWEVLTARMPVRDVCAACAEFGAWELADYQGL
jgi:hypothetical protein